MRNARLVISGAGKPGHACAAAMPGRMDGMLAGVVRHMHPPWIKVPAVIPASECGTVDAAFVQDRALDAAFLDKYTRGFVADALRGALRLAAEKVWMQGMFVRIERSTT